MSSRRLTIQQRKEVFRDLVAIQDHAYNHTFLDTWTLITFLAAKTQQIHFLPDVADLPLRPPTMLAKAASRAARSTLSLVMRWR